MVCVMQNFLQQHEDGDADNTHQPRGAIVRLALEVEGAPTTTLTALSVSFSGMGRGANVVLYSKWWQPLGGIGLSSNAELISVQRSR